MSGNAAKFNERKNMATFLRTADLDTLIREADQMIPEVQQIFGSLTAEQLNWKPGADEWSVGQCFEHLTIATSSYFPLLRAIQAGTKHQTMWERIPLLPGVWSNLLMNMIEPDGSGKAVAPPAWQPSQSAIDAGMVATFLRCDHECLELMRASHNLDLTMIIASPAAAFITYSLLDAYRIIVIHNRLHIGQAQRVMQQPGFPAIG
jgi:hypothetical protein